MLQPLPAETVFEAKARTKRATGLLFVLLVLIYAVFSNLIVFASIVLFAGHAGSVESFGINLQQNFWSVVLWSTLGAFLLAFFHFWVATAKNLKEILDDLGSMPADPKDDPHLKFIHIVEEAEVALGGRKIEPVIIATLGANAFSIEDGAGNAAIGVTEGLLSRLDRAELSSAIAHEAAHLAHGDSRLTTIACSLLSVFDILRSSLGGSGNHSNKNVKIRMSGRAAIARLVLWSIASLGYFITKLIYMGISRGREHYADADGIQMCKDPLSLAEALYKISSGYRGSVDVPDGLSAIFIMNPKISSLDEQENFFANLFSTHPPVNERLDKLMTWAKSDLTRLKEKIKSETAQVVSTPKPTQPVPEFYAHHDGAWKGPYTPLQMLTLGLINPQTMIRGSTNEEIYRASENPLFVPLFENQIAEPISKHKCPRCNVHLIETSYEGAPTLQCVFCKGYLLKKGVLDRLIVRRDDTFVPNQIESVKSKWITSQKEDLKTADHFPLIKCPSCETGMYKAFHNLHTRIVIDQCMNGECRAIWLDTGELESIQILIENPNA